MNTIGRGNIKICIIAASINMGGMQRAAVNIYNQFATHNYDITW